jgi:uroporphyrinogen-III synthase
MKIKSILVSQPKPLTDKSPYFDLSKKYNLKIDFRPFVQVEGISVKEFRKSRIDVCAHSAIIFNSRTAVDHFFRICEELKVTIKDTWKYFCISESIAFYLQKYVVYRKRKIFFGNGRFDDLLDIIKKYSDEKFLVPLSDIHKQEIPSKLTEANIDYTKAILYRTISADLSDLKDVNYDVLVFFSPAGLASLFQNFPDYIQNGTQIATFGPSTAKAVETHGLKLNIKAPVPNAPSMTAALEQFIKANK